MWVNIFLLLIIDLHRMGRFPGTHPVRANVETVPRFFNTVKPRTYFVQSPIRCATSSSLDACPSVTTSSSSL